MENEEKVTAENKQQPPEDYNTTSATAGNQKAPKVKKMIRLFLLFMIRAGVSTENSHVINDLIVIQEFGKLILASALEYNPTNGHLDRPKDFFPYSHPIIVVSGSKLSIACGGCKLLTTAAVSAINRSNNGFVLLHMGQTSLCRDH